VGPEGAPHNPDRYYRGFDNTRIRTGALRHRTSRMRGATGGAPGPGGHHHCLHSWQKFLSTLSAAEASISLERGSLGGGEGEGGEGGAPAGYTVPYPAATAGHPSPHRSLFRTFMPGPIDKEEGGGEAGHAGG